MTRKCPGVQFWLMKYLEGDEPEDQPDREDPDPEDADWDDETDTVPCPHCRRQIAGEAEWCAHCGMYISQDDSPSDKKPIWLIAGVVLLLVIVLTWVLRVVSLGL